MPTETKTVHRTALVVDGFNLSNVRRFIDLDEEGAAMLAGFLGDMAAGAAEWAAKLAEVEGERDAELEKTAAAEGAQATEAAAAEEMRDSLAKATARITELEADVKEAPKRAAELVELRETAKRVHDSTDYAKLEDAEAVKRAAVVGRNDKHAKSPAVVIDAVFDAFVSQLADAVSPKPGGPWVNWNPQQRSVNDSKPNPNPGRGAQTLAHINGPRAN